MTEEDARSVYRMTQGCELLLLKALQLILQESPKEEVWRSIHEARDQLLEQQLYLRKQHPSAEFRP